MGVHCGILIPLPKIVVRMVYLPSLPKNIWGGFPVQNPPRSEESRRSKGVTVLNNQSDYSLLNITGLPAQADAAWLW